MDPNYKFDPADWTESDGFDWNNMDSVKALFDNKEKDNESHESKPASSRLANEAGLGDLFSPISISVGSGDRPK